MYLSSSLRGFPICVSSKLGQKRLLGTSSESTFGTLLVLGSFEGLVHSRDPKGAVGGQPTTWMIGVYPSQGQNCISSVINYMFDHWQITTNHHKPYCNQKH